MYESFETEFSSKLDSGKFGGKKSLGPKWETGRGVEFTTHEISHSDPWLFHLRSSWWFFLGRRSPGSEWIGWNPFCSAQPEDSRRNTAGIEWKDHTANSAFVSLRSDVPLLLSTGITSHLEWEMRAELHATEKWEVKHSNPQVTHFVRLFACFLISYFQNTTSAPVFQKPNSIWKLRDWEFRNREMADWVISHTVLLVWEALIRFSAAFRNCGFHAFILRSCFDRGVFLEIKYETRRDF